MEIYNENKKEKINTKDYDEHISIFRITKMIDTLSENKICKKIIIYKDSTASGLQHLSRMLCPKNIHMYKVLNISNINL
jgi:hypothetical protein